MTEMPDGLTDELPTDPAMAVAPDLVPEPPEEPQLEFDRSLRPLDPRAVTLWRIGGALSMLFWGPLLFLPVFFVDQIVSLGETHWLLDISVATVLAVLMASVRVVLFPQLRYRYWRFQLTEEHLFLQRGFIVVRRTMIPLVRVQNVDTVQGPIARRFDLWSVVVFTAANAQSIPSLSQAEADHLRKTIAELARRARDED